ncbi:probable plastid-lipid-associated protein 4, chloroplastic isoform X4 [Syzygium oleosum]|uniref:probable plastid-lipid-associated protein 4, chloroplastic isoform X4 n=1 Tax=Syzygium oleosum TaxID=219896 RepID=UPI0024BBA584|nr:probable plastid-lipid-associated protein 4, chloroplastic isoform X4 [Syzygium oleosum]
MSMALSYQPPPPPPPTTLNCKTSSSTSIAPALIRSQFPAKSNALFLQNNHGNLLSLNSSSPEKWRAQVSFFPAFLGKRKDVTTLKEELLEAIAPLDRGAEATPEDQQRVDQIARKLEAVNPTKEPLKSTLLNGKWELIYTTSKSILQTQVTADLTPLNTRKVAVKFDFFKIAGLIPIKAPGRARGELEITYLDEELRISRGDKGNLFVLKMVDPSYRVPV